MLSIHIRGLGRIIFPVFIAVHLFLLALPASAGTIYKWRDENGRLIFSDTPRDEETEVVRETKDPEPAPDVSSDTSATDSAADEEDKEDEKPAEDVITIPYVSREGGSSRVIVKVTFNGRVTAPMLLDTGAPGLVISARLANRLNLFDRDGSQLMTLISGIGGSEYAMRTIIDSVKIGNITAEVIPAHIRFDAADAYEGLVGMDVLAGYSLTINPEIEQIIARKIPESPKRPGGYYKSWWEEKFREFRYFKEYWEHHAMLVEKSGTAYAKMYPKKRERYKEFINHQKNEADLLYRKLSFKANRYLIPKHWRE